MAQILRTKTVPVDFLLNCYDAFLREDDMYKVAGALNITPTTLRQRLSRYPELQFAKELAERRRGSTESFSTYIFKRLSPAAKKIWEDIQFWHDADNSYERIEKILAGQTKKLRQELFIHALVSSSFDVSTACYMVCVPRRTYEEWKSDLEFRQLIDEIQWHKENFFEKKLVGLIEQDVPAAVIFANKTVNAKRGYNEKLTLEHTGNIGTALDLDTLDLPLDVKRQIFEAIKKSEKNKSVARQAMDDIRQTEDGGEMVDERGGEKSGQMATPTSGKVVKMLG